MPAIEIEMGDNKKVAFVGDIHFDNNQPVARLDNYMDTCCHKVDLIGEVCRQEGVRYLFFSGDIFNRINCSHECVNRAGQVLLSLKEKNIRLFSICGNHDLPRDSLDRLAQSPLETMFRFGIIEHVCAAVPVIFHNSCKEGHKALVSAFDYTQEITPADNSFTSNILLAHMFFNQSGVLADESQNISREKMATLGYDVAFLGHDHEEYNPFICGNTLVVRSGSLVRSTAHDYNFTRKPGFIIIDDIYNPVNARKTVIGHKPFTDVVSQAVINKKQKEENIVDHGAISNLAKKLSERDETGSNEDIIYKAIMEDRQVSGSCRKILLDYIARAR